MQDHSEQYCAWTMNPNSVKHYLQKFGHRLIPIILNKVSGYDIVYVTPRLFYKLVFTLHLPYIVEGSVIFLAIQVSCVRA